MSALPPSKLDFDLPPPPPPPAPKPKGIGALALGVVTHQHFMTVVVSIVTAAALSMFFTQYVTDAMVDRGRLTPERQVEVLKKVQTWATGSMGAFSVLVIIGYIFRSAGAAGIPTGLAGFVTQPAVIFTLLNVLVFSVAINPRFRVLQNKLQKELPEYAKASTNAMIARLVTYTLTGGAVALISWRLSRMPLTPGRVLAAVGIIMGMLTLTNNIVKSYADLARLVLFSELKWQPEATILYMDTAMNSLAFDFLKTWFVPLLTAGMVVYFHRKSVGVVGIANFIAQNLPTI